MTFKQALDLNAHVRKGEKGSLVVYANSFTRTEEDAEGQEIEREIPFLKGYTVFNVEQIEGLPEHYYAKPEPKFTAVQRIDHAEAFFAATHADIRYRGGRAYYAQEADYIQMPPIESFRDAESFYATLAHETIHWTKHPSRLNATSAARPGATKAMPAKNSSPNWAPLSFAPISNSRRKSATTTRPTSPPGLRFSRTTTARSSRPLPTRSAPSIICTASSRSKPRPPHRRPLKTCLKIGQISI